jgi:hypothetical protein
MIVILTTSQNWQKKKKLLPKEVTLEFGGCCWVIEQSKMFKPMGLTSGWKQLQKMISIKCLL